MPKYNTIAIIGKSGAGKDTLLQEILECLPQETHKIITYTTRPMREGEVNGKNYFFVTQEEFASIPMIESTCFKGNWYYGTSLQSFDETKVNIGVFNPSGVKNLLKHEEINLTIVLIDTSDKVRLLRSLLREEAPDCQEIVRRFLADEEDFKDLSFKTYNIKNENPAERREATAALRILVQSQGALGKTD